MIIFIRNISFICLLLLLMSCTDDKISVVYSKSISKIDFSLYKKYGPMINYNCRPFFKVNNGNVKIKGLNKENSFFEYSSETDTIDYFKYPLEENIDEYSFSFHEYGLNYVSNNNLVLLDEEYKKLSTIPLGLGQRDFISYPLYRSPILELDGSYYIQIGNDKDSLNFIGDYIFQKITENQSEKAVKYPELFKNKYIHYHDAAVVHFENKIYYCFPNLDILNSVNIDNNEYSESKIPDGNFTEFDTEKIKDILYIHDFTINNCSNINLYLVGNYIVLLQRSKPDHHRLILFDQTLTKVGEVPLNHKIDYYLVYSDGQQLHFGIPFKNELISYEF